MLQQGADKKKPINLLGNSPGTSLTCFNLPVEIIEEREQVKAQLTPGFLLAVVENVGVHHAHRVVHDLRAVGRSVEKPEKEERLGSPLKWSQQKLLRHLLWDCTSTDGKRAGGYSGQVWPTLQHTWTSDRRARGWSTPAPQANQKTQRAAV